MPADTCGARNGALVCDRPPHVDGDHRGYDEEHDAVLFWPTSEKRIQHLEDQIAGLLEELDTDPPAPLRRDRAAPARQRIGVDSIDGTAFSRWPRFQIPRALAWLEDHRQQPDLALEGLE